MLLKSAVSLMNNTSYKLTTLLWELQWRSLSPLFAWQTLENDKRLAHLNPLFARGLSMTFSVWNVPMEEVSILVNFAKGPTIYSLSRKTVNTRENFWNVYCFATNQKRDETAKDNRQTAAWISHDLIRNNELAFSSNKLAFLPQLTFKNQTTEFGMDLKASVNCQNLQRYKFSDEGFSARKNTDRKPPITAN